jgi:F420H(2)-dependent biliverdin reductase
MSHWTPGWDDVPAALAAFWAEYHLGSLTTLRPDGRLHVVPVGCTLDVEERCAWVIASGTSRKARNLARPGPVAFCQVDRARWATLEGTGVARTDADSVARAEQMYAARYRAPRENPARVAIRIEVDRIMCSAALLG